jgi:hypothetical protein
MEKYGRAWRIISKRMVKTRTAEQVRIHAQKYFYKQAKKAGKNKRKCTALTHPCSPDPASAVAVAPVPRPS